MLYNLDKFTSQISSKGLASPNKFYLKFTKIPSTALGNSGIQDLNIMCESAVLAGRNVQSLLDRQYGLNREVAYNGPTYNPITLSFLCTKDYTEKRILDRWNNLIVDISNGYDVEYYNNYIGEMTVSALDVTGKETYSIHYKECWPKTVNGVELNHSTQNTAARITVEMAYAYWTSDDIDTNKVDKNVIPNNPTELEIQG